MADALGVANLDENDEWVARRRQPTRARRGPGGTARPRALDVRKLVDAGAGPAILATDVPGETQHATYHNHDRSPEANTGPDVLEDPDRGDSGRR